MVVVADAMEERVKELIWLEGDGVRGCHCPGHFHVLRLAGS